MVILPFQYREVSDDVIDTGLTGQRESAFLFQLGPAFAVAMFHDNDQFRASGDQVHRTADAAEFFVFGAPVGDAAFLVHLIGAEHHGVDTPTTRHFE